MDFSQLDDGVLLEFIVDARKEALNALYERYGRLVYTVALRVVGEPAAAEEITLDTFVKVWEKAASYRAEKGLVRVWLTSMARNQAIDVLRRDDSRAQMQHKIWVEMAGEAKVIERAPESLLVLNMRKEKVQAAIRLLTDEQREVLSLAYFQGFTQSQIAEFCNLPLGTVKTRIRSAIQKLRTILDEDNFG